MRPKESVYVVLERGGGEVFHLGLAERFTEEVMALDGVALAYATRHGFYPDPLTLCGESFGPRDSVRQFPPDEDGWHLCRVCGKRADRAQDGAA